jgi:methyl-accepting chemotaxis protein
MVFVFVGIARPLIALVAGMKKLGEGDFSVVLPGLGRKDEIGAMAGAVAQFKIKAEEKARQEAEAKTEQDRIAAVRRKADMQKLADQFETAVGEIVQTVSSASSELEASATTLTKTAENTRKLTIVVASASEEASTNVQSVASAAEEMAASVDEIGRQVQESSRISNEAVGQAQKTDERIAKLSQAAGRIGDVTQLITTIAEQTNLLALNATIEAARAGEAGKGFAVVASEVKELAQETARATEDISQRVQAIQVDTTGAVTAIEEISQVIARISDFQTTIASAVEEQTATTTEMNRSVNEAAIGTGEIAENINGVAAAARQTSEGVVQSQQATDNLAGMSRELTALVGNFRY